jgi:hypothetical protein
MNAILVDDYPALVGAIRHRIAEIDLTYESADELAGFCSRYTSKLLCDPPMRRMTADSMFALMGAVGLALELVPAEWLLD